MKPTIIIFTLISLFTLSVFGQATPQAPEPRKLTKPQQERLTAIDQEITKTKASAEAAQKRFEATRARSESSTEAVALAEAQVKLAQTEQLALTKYFDYLVLQVFIEDRLDPEKYEQKLSVIDLAGTIGFAVKTEGTIQWPQKSTPPAEVQTSVPPKKD